MGWGVRNGISVWEGTEITRVGSVAGTWGCRKIENGGKKGHLAKRDRVGVHITGLQGKEPPWQRKLTERLESSSTNYAHHLRELSPQTPVQACMVAITSILSKQDNFWSQICAFYHYAGGVTYKSCTYW